MLAAIDYTDKLAYQQFRNFQLVFTRSPSPQLITSFMNALNDNGHLPYSVSDENLLQAPYIQIAHTAEGEFVAGCTIKHYDGQLAEIGFMLVEKKYRQLGLGEYMTRLRINVARQLGIEMLYAKVRGKNISSMNNLSKAGFQSAGNFLSQKDLYSTITWMYLPLQRMSRHECHQRLLRKLDGLIPVIGNMDKYAARNGKISAIDIFNL